MSPRIPAVVLAVVAHLAVVSCQTGALLDISRFSVSREIPAGPVGPQVLLLDAAVLAHASQPELGDVRIVTTSGRQIPFIIEKLDEPLSMALPPLEATTPPRGAALANERMTGTRSYYRLLLPYASLPHARLVFETPARVFERELIVMSEPKASDSRYASVTRSIAGRRWAHADPDTPAPSLTLDIEPPDSRNMLVVVDEGANPPLPLSAPRLLLPSYRLRFFRDSEAPCLLLYGQKGLTAPQYDLALLESRLAGAPAHEIVPGPERSGAPAPAGTSKVVLYGVVLVLAVGVLLMIVVRLVKRKA